MLLCYPPNCADILQSAAASFSNGARVPSDPVMLIVTARGVFVTACCKVVVLTACLKETTADFPYLPYFTSV